MSGNLAPATAIVTSSIGAGVAATAVKFTDVREYDVNFIENTITITRMGGQIEIYDYSAMNTMTWTITTGATSITITS